MKNIKIVLMFDGTAYHGFQRQNNAVTIQETLEKSISRITGENISLTGCSRTDAGVHAKMYVANFLSDTKIPPDKIPFALNSALPDDIKVLSAGYEDEEFNARKHAVEKTYCYTVINRVHNEVFLKRYGWFFPYPLDVEKMQKAAAFFEGEHDFSAFMSAGGSAKTFVRHMKKLNVTVEDDGVIKIYATANGFLYNMVRIIAGTLVCVGAGRIKCDDIPDIILSKERKRAGITAPPEGLMLLDVKY